MRTKLVKVELTYWTRLPLPGSGSGSPDQGLPIQPDETDPDYGLEEGGEIGGGLPNRPSKEEVLEMLKEYEEQIREKIEAFKAELADRIPGAKEKLEAVLAEIVARIEEFKNRPIDPGFGVEEGAGPGHLPSYPGRPGHLPSVPSLEDLKAKLELVKAKVEALKAEFGDRVAGAREKLEAIKDAIANFPGFGDCHDRMEAIKAAINAKIEALKADLAGKGADVVAKIEAAKAVLVERINTIKEGVDPGYGVPEASPKVRRRR
jgi:DNA repair exonuclease SbcCD ATPase subunit